MLLSRHKELTGQSGAKSPGTLSRFSLSRLLFNSPKKLGPGLGSGSASGQGLGPTAQGQGLGAVTPSSSSRSAGRQGLGPGSGSGQRSGPASGPGSGSRRGQGLEPGQGQGQCQHNSFAYTSSVRRSWMVRRQGLDSTMTDNTPFECNR